MTLDDQLEDGGSVDLGECFGCYWFVWVALAVFLLIVMLFDLLLLFICLRSSIKKSLNRVVPMVYEPEYVPREKDNDELGVALPTPTYSNLPGGHSHGCHNGCCGHQTQAPAQPIIIAGMDLFGGRASGHSHEYNRRRSNRLDNLPTALPIEDVPEYKPVPKPKTGHAHSHLVDKAHIKEPTLHSTKSSRSYSRPVSQNRSDRSDTASSDGSKWYE